MIIGFHRRGCAAIASPRARFGFTLDFNHAIELADSRAARLQRRRSSARERRRRRSRAGAAALEMALVLPLFVLLILGLIDFGHMLYTVNTITNAAREGARRGVVQPDEDDITAAAIAGAETYLTAAGIEGATADAEVGATGDVVVTVSVPEYTNITGFSYNLPGLSATALGASRTLSSVSTMRWEFYTPP